jgi:hypothetical protein
MELVVEQSRQGLIPVNRRVMSLFQQMERKHLLRGSAVQGEGGHEGEGKLVDQERRTPMLSAGTKLGEFVATSASTRG